MGKEKVLEKFCLHRPGRMLDSAFLQLQYCTICLSISPVSTMEDTMLTVA